MRGSTRKRGRTWTAYYDGPATLSPETGKTTRSQKSKGGFRTRKDAEAFLSKTVDAVRAGRYIEPSREPLAAFLRGWLQAATPGVKPLTAARYKQTIEGQIALREIGRIPLCQVTPKDVLRLLADLERCHDPKCDHARGDCRGLTASSRSVMLAVLRRALNDAVEWEQIERNPAARVKAPTTGQTRVMAWTDTELRRFLAHVEHDRLVALWRLAATTGMRRGELLGVRWEDVDLDASRLRVEQQLLPTPFGVTFGPPKSRRSRRTITLDAVTVEALGDHRDRQLLEQSLAGDAYAHGDLVFCDELGGPIHPNALSNRFITRRKGAGIPVGSIHVLRHTAATLALTATPPVPLHVVAGRLGDRPETVLATYAHLLPSSDAAAADAVAALVDKSLTSDPAEVV